MDKAKAIEALLAEWENQQKESGYEYEQNFIEVMRGLNIGLLQLSGGGECPKATMKKSSDTIGGDRSSQGTPAETIGGFRQRSYPNLNLLERLWKFIQKKVLHGKYYSIIK